MAILLDCSSIPTANRSARRFRRCFGVPILGISTHCEANHGTRDSPFFSNNARAMATAASRRRCARPGARHPFRDAAVRARFLVAACAGADALTRLSATRHAHLRQRTRRVANLQYVSMCSRPFATSVDCSESQSRRCATQTSRNASITPASIPLRPQT